METQHNGTILIVEDERKLAQLLSDYLKLEHFQSHCINDGLNVVSWVKDNHPDLVLLDIYMPLKDGFEVLRDMRRDPVLRKIPVIMLTSSGRGEDVNRAYEEGANTFITKPSDVDGLKKAIKLFADYWSETAQLPSTS